LVQKSSSRAQRDLAQQRRSSASLEQVTQHEKTEPLSPRARSAALADRAARP
jgi:hypothetical protein